MRGRKNPATVQLTSEAESAGKPGLAANAATPELRPKDVSHGEPEKSPAELSRDEETEDGSSDSKTPVVGIGASAGGLDAFQLLLANLPADTGFAFVLVQHLDPTHVSSLTGILARMTPMPVMHAEEGMSPEANSVYVIPPNTVLRIANGKLRLEPRRQTDRLHLPIDLFLKSLARDYGTRAIGVILSGAGADGAAGLLSIKEAGGITFTQDPDTTEFPSMPQMAAAATNVDFVLSPERIARELVRIARHPFFAEAKFSIDPDVPSQSIRRGRRGSGPQADEQFREIFRVMYQATGIDFSLYSERTVQRRIMRRLALRNILSFEAYARELQSDPAERGSLERDLLISVTSFFRDPDSFEILKQTVFPQIVENRPSGATIRIWVAGCATGEEAYSIAICLQEYLLETGQTFPVQIFASDISEAAIDKARSGRYLDNIVADVSTERLSRNFSRSDGAWQINKSLRDMCVFSRHNLIDDPPFSNVDLVSCRNVLIYLRTVQKNILPLFHYALRENGFLMLGRSETASFENLFSTFDAIHRIYAKRSSPRTIRRFRSGARARGVGAGQKALQAPESELWDGLHIGKEVDQVLLSRYSPAGVVVDEQLDVIEIRGQVAPYLKLPAGKLNFSLLTLVPEAGFFLELERLVQQAKLTGTSVRRGGLEYRHDSQTGETDVEVLPLHGRHSDSRHGRAFLILFEPASSRWAAATVPPGTGSGVEDRTDSRDSQIRRLKQDLAEARQRMLAMIEEHQTAAEENQNATEEALSTNEELQSLNEELETAKEELQSTNEELITVNQELQSKNTALAHASHVAMSIVETIRVPLLVIDTDFRIRSANPAFCRAFHVSAQEARGKLLYSFCEGSWNSPGLRDVMNRVQPSNSSFQDFEMEQEFPGLGHRSLVLSGCRLDGLKLILLAIDDVTRSRDAGKAMRTSEEHLQQIRKMEAIRHLASGIAHNFTNVITAILGYTGLLLDKVTDAGAILQVREIQNAADRADALTKQLSAFSQRQVLQPRVVNLNSVVADFDQILRRIVGERIYVVLDTSPDLWRVRVDPGELGRAVMNLCLNARDAMPGGGGLTVRTANVELAGAEARAENLPAGNYVLLEVSDTGLGIDPELKARIFEPFFTTKDVRKGAGLGLATVLGIVEQSDGAIRCDSEPGRGTTFRIYLPALSAIAESAEREALSLADAPKGSGEVVMIVEEEDMVRKVTRTLLETSGYVVLEAREGGEAAGLLDSHEGAIDLLLTDVMMAGVSGRELAAAAVAVRPEMKVLFLSSYPENAVLREGLRGGTAFLQKPFRPVELACKVREVLDAG